MAHCARRRGSRESATVRSWGKGSGLSNAGADLHLSHNTIARNTGGDGSGLYVVDLDFGQPTIVMTNTILANQPVGICASGISTVTVNGILWHNTPITVSKSVTAVVTVNNQFRGGSTATLKGEIMARPHLFKQFAFTCLIFLAAVFAILASSPVDSRAAVQPEYAYARLSTGSENGQVRKAAKVSALPLLRKRAVELKLDDLPDYPAVERRDPALREASSSKSLVIDDGRLESAYGVNDDTNAYQFIWFNRFTPQATDFPFRLSEIWVMFDNTSIETSVYPGDAIDLVVYRDPDGAPANGANWLATSSVTVQAVDGLTWSVYALSPSILVTGPGDILIGVINRHVESGVSDLNFPATIDTTSSQERSWIGWWNEDPPGPPNLPPDNTLSLMAGVNGGNWLIRGYGELVRIYLPLVMKGAGPPPAPTLYGVDNADGDGSYTVNWSSVDLATNYTLQEDDNASFASPATVFSGLGTSKALLDKPIGTYYYRVRAENAYGPSAWSATQSVAVSVVSQLICETHNFGTTPGTALPITPSGLTWTFTAERTMMVERIETLSNMKALFPVTVIVQVYINDAKAAEWNVYVNLNAYQQYIRSRDVSMALNQGDVLKYVVKKYVGDTEAWIRWGNYVKLCGR